MSEFIIPEVGAKGVYSFKAPFDTLPNKQTEYECMSVRKITDALAAGENVFARYYEPYELDRAAYEADIASGVILIGLQSALGQTLDIPNSYLTSYPDASGVRYRVMALAVDLGAIADTMNLEVIISELKELIGARIGITPEIATVATSQPALISYEDHERLEAARQSKITIDNSLTVRYNTLVAERDQLLQKNAALVKYIREKSDTQT